MKGSALNMNRPLPKLPLTGERSNLELSFSLLDESSVISSVIKIDVCIPASAINGIMGLLGGQFYVSRFHEAIKFMCNKKL